MPMLAGRAKAIVGQRVFAGVTCNGLIGEPSGKQSMATNYGEVGGVKVNKHGFKPSKLEPSFCLRCFEVREVPAHIMPKVVLSVAFGKPYWEMVRLHRSPSRWTYGAPRVSSLI